MAKPRDYGLFKQVGKRWIREYPDKSFRLAKAGKVFSNFILELPKYDGLQRSIRMVPNGKA